MLHARARILYFDIREGVRAALVPDQQRVALRVITRTFCALQNFHLPTVGILPMSCRNAL